MVGDKLKQRRMELKLTQQQLADMVGAKKTTISNYECGISSPSENTIITLMEVLKCDANYLFGYNKTNALQPPNVQRVMINIAQLNDDGLEALADYSDFLKGQTKFKKVMSDKNAREA